MENKSDHELYQTWQDMKNRCYNKNNRIYSHYGGRGISVSDLWRYNFTKFIEDMGPRPTGYSLDRIDNDKGYRKENCRWASKSTQTRNRRCNSSTGYIGVYPNGKKYRVEAKINSMPVQLGTFQYPEDAAKARDEYLYSQGVTEGFNFKEDYN